MIEPLGDKCTKTIQSDRTDEENARAFLLCLYEGIATWEGRRQVNLLTEAQKDVDRILIAKHIRDKMARPVHHAFFELRTSTLELIRNDFLKKQLDVHQFSIEKEVQEKQRQLQVLGIAAEWAELKDTRSKLKSIQACVIEKAEEIARWSQLVNEVNAKKIARSQELDQLTSTIHVLETQLAQVRRELVEEEAPRKELEYAIASEKKEIKKIREDIEEYSRSKGTVEGRLEELDAELKGTPSTIRQQKIAERDQLSTKMTKLITVLRVAQEDMERRKRIIEANTTAISGLKTRPSTVLTKYDQTKKGLDRITQQRETLESEMHQISEQMGDIDRRRDLTQQERTQCKTTLGTIQDNLTRLERKLTAKYGDEPEEISATVKWDLQKIRETIRNFEHKLTEIQDQKKSVGKTVL